MTDKNKNMGDEYQFPHDEYVAAEDDTKQQPNYDAFQGQGEAEESASASTDAPKAKKGLTERFPFLQNKRVLIVVGVVVVAIIVFQMTKPSHTVKVVKQAQQVQRQQVPSLQEQQQNALLNKVDSLSQAANSSKNAESQLAGEVSQLKTSLNQSANNNKAMREAMIALANQVQGLQEQLKKATTTPKHIKKLPPAPVLTFRLRAIIPGRAWIEGSNGEADSVAVGNKIKNYGKVTAIDADAGKVVTSSGKDITYNGDGN